jgi:GntR family transcriptional regulator, transcriptional repressor for pyruvate dehydrogenase complex
MALKQITQNTVVMQVMEQIKELISSGEYKPGDKFPTEFELAEMFGIGRSSIREALKIFQHLGILKSKVSRGTYVCDSSNISKEALTWSILLGNRDFYDLMEFRLVMEQQGLWYILVLRAAETGFRDAITTKLTAEVERMKTAVRQKDYNERLEADYNFHKHIIHACGNEIFNNLYETLHAFLRHEIEDAQDQIHEYAIKSPSRHQLLIDVIMEGDYIRAVDTYRQHIHNINELYDQHSQNV